MLVTLCRLLCASNSAQVSPCWYLHAGESVQATLRYVTLREYLHAGISMLVTLCKYLHAGNSVQAALR